MRKSPWPGDSLEMDGDGFGWMVKEIGMFSNKIGEKNYKKAGFVLKLTGGYDHTLVFMFQHFKSAASRF